MLMDIINNCGRGDGRAEYASFLCLAVLINDDCILLSLQKVSSIIVCTVPHLEPFVYVNNVPFLLSRMGAVQD